MTRVTTPLVHIIKSRVTHLSTNYYTPGDNTIIHLGSTMLPLCKRHRRTTTKKRCLFQANFNTIVMLITTHDQLDIQFAYFCESNYYLFDRRHVHSYAPSHPSCTPASKMQQSLNYLLLRYTLELAYTLSVWGKERIIIQSSSGLQIKSRRV